MAKQDKLKVAIVVNNFPSLSETFVALQVAELAQQGHEISIYNLGNVGDKNWLPAGTENIFYNQVKIENFNETSKKHSIKYIVTSLLKLNLIQTLKIILFGKFKLGRNLALREMSFLSPLAQYNIVHFQFATLADKYFFYDELGLWKAKAKYVCSIRGFDVTKREFENKIKWPKLFEKCTVFLPVCEYLQNKLLSKNTSALSYIVPSPVNIEKFPQARECNKEDNKKLKFVSVGRLVEKKGIEIAIKAIYKIKNSELNFHYYIIGDGELKEHLEKLVSNLNLHEYVFFKGALPSQDTILEMESASLMLVPSMTAKDGDSEGIPNVIKEAMLLNIPVVTTDHSGIPELVKDKHTGFIGKQGDVDSFYEAILQAINMQAIWPELQNNAYNYVKENYSPLATTMKLLDSYRVALEKNN